MTRRSCLQTLASAALIPATACLSRRAADAVSPRPYGPLPTVGQLAWSALEYYNFLHFTINTFTDKEWGYGNESPALFNPTAFDADAIVETLKASGSKAVILTCKHHDGFCLWPTKTTPRSLKNSPFQGGKGDIVRDISRAAERAGLGFGVYLSPWDRSQASYGRPAYLAIYREQARELLGNYGPIFEIWHDGANGGDGYYGGAREKRVIDKLHYYDWQNTWGLERQLQPQAVIFSDVGPDVRWVGNEKGQAGETCWATATPLSPNGRPGSPGDVREADLTTGARDGKFWMPAECDVSIRPGWFWHAAEDGQVKTPDQLLDLYDHSVGRGGSFLLNVPPDRRGLLAEPDTKSLRAFGQQLQRRFRTNLLQGSRLTASNTRMGSHPEYLIDGSKETHWATDDAVHTAEVVFEQPQPVKLSRVRIREDIRLGQRVDAFAIEAWLPGGSTKGGWKTIATGTSIGMCRILATPQPVTASKFRLRITQAAASPVLSEFSAYAD